MACQGCTCGQAQLELARRVDKIEIKQRDPSKLMGADNTVITLNGVPIKNPQSIEVKIAKNGDAYVKLELFAKVDMDQSLVKDAEITGDESGT
jgi:hypothetical protein